MCSASQDLKSTRHPVTLTNPWWQKGGAFREGGSTPPWVNDVFLEVVNLVVSKTIGWVHHLGPKEGSASTSPHTRRFEVRWPHGGVWVQRCLQTCLAKSSQDQNGRGSPRWYFHPVCKMPCDHWVWSMPGRGQPIKWAWCPAVRRRSSAKNPAMPPPTTTISVSNPTLMRSFSVFGEPLVKPNSRIR